MSAPKCVECEERELCMIQRDAMLCQSCLDGKWYPRVYGVKLA